MKREEVESLFRLARIQVLALWELPNQYNRRPSGVDCSDEQELLRWAKCVCQSPWWLVKTPVGLIEIGWRKRVISISWDDLPVRAVLTEDDVTKSDVMVHAWTTIKALEYLSALGAEIDKLPLVVS